jgi:Protein of unknown function (DUF2950)
MNARSALGIVAAIVILTAPCAAQQNDAAAFASPEGAARALAAAARAEGMDALLAIFGSAGRDLLDTSDPGTSRRNREIFTVAFAEEWRIEDLGINRKELVIGHESWPFPVPLLKTARGWVFDVAAGKQEILNRRIGRNELVTIQTCLAYVKAQQAYAKSGHDGKPAGVYAQRVSSDPGTQNGLYWPAQRDEPRSPLGDLVAQAAADGQPRDPSQPGRTPFHGYYFRILDAQGAAASGGAKSYVVDGQMTGGFALVAWPAQYDATGIMTFIVNQDGIVYERDLGPETTSTAPGITRYDPDSAWRRADRATPSR